MARPKLTASTALPRLLAILLTAALLLSLVPLYGVTPYTRAGVDDYRYGYRAHEALAAGGNFFDALDAAAAETRATYFEWQGSYAAIFLMSLEPAVFGETYYGVGPCVLLTALVSSLLLFTFLLLRRLTGMRRAYAWSLSVLLTAGAVHFLPSPCEGYYWFNGGVYYTFFFSLSLFAACVLLWRAQKRRIAQWPLLLLLAAVIGGGNLVTGLLSCVLLGVYLAYQLVKKRFDPLTAAALCVLGVCFLVNALAPGNGVRQAEHLAARSAGPFSAILQAMLDTLYYAKRWLFRPASFLLLAGAPLVWMHAGREDTAFRFRFPPLVTAASFLLLSVGFTPTEYALGTAGEARLIDIQFCLFLLLSLLNMVWYVGWLRQHCQWSKALSQGIACLVVIVSFFWMGLGMLQTRDCAFVSAVRILQNGTARAYAEGWRERYALLNDPAQTEVVLPALANKPPLICLMDPVTSTMEENYWYNQQLERYYHKAQVLAAPMPGD